MPRKPRSDAKLLTLPDEDQTRVYDWLCVMSYAKTRAKIKKELDLSVSLGALNHFWEVRSRTEQQQRILKAVSASDAILEQSRDALPRLKEANAAALQQAAFEAFLSGDVDRIQTLYGLVLKTRSEATKATSAELARDRFEFDAAKAALEQLDALRDIGRDSSLSETAKITAVRRRLFSVLPDEGVPS